MARTDSRMNLQLWRLYVAFFLLLMTRLLDGKPCPCLFAPKEDDLFSDRSGLPKTICIVNSNEREDPSISTWYSIMRELHDDPRSFVVPGLHITLVTSYAEGTNNRSMGDSCDSYMQIISDDSLNHVQRKTMRQQHYISCPGTCLPVPRVEIPSSIVKSWLEIGEYEDWPSSKQKQVR